MFTELGIPEELKTEFYEIINNLGLKRKYPMYILNRLESDILVTGYSIPYRAKVIARWHELERMVIQPKITNDNQQYVTQAEFRLARNFTS